MDAITALHTRTASPRLTDPAPNGEELDTIYKAALRAPDHARLRPWQFLVIQGEGRNRMGDLLVDTMQPGDEDKQQKLREKPLRAPMIIVAVAKIVEHEKVPAVEQVCSTAAAVQNMSLAVHALGYASIWRTGAPAYSDAFKAGLGLDDDDDIVGFLYIGTPTVTERPIPELDVDDYFKDWGK